MNTSPVRWGIIGTGMIAGLFRDALERSDKAMLHAVASRDIERAREFNTDSQEVSSYGSYQELINDPDVEAIYIATPQSRHLSDALSAIQGGKHVIVEKPLVLSSEDAHQLQQAANKHPQLVIEGMWTLFNPLVKKLLDLVNSGELGKLLTFTANTGPIGVPATHRAFSAELGGSLLWECLVYPVSILTAIDPQFHTPAELYSRSLLLKNGVDYASTVTLQTHSSFAQFSGSFAADMEGAARSNVQMLFENGWAELSEIYNPSELRIGWKNGPLEEFKIDSNEAGFLYEIEGFSSAVRGNSILDSNLLLNQSVKNMELLELIKKHTES